MTPREPVPEAYFEVVQANGPASVVPITHAPFRIGRGGDVGNDLQLDDRRVSRRSSQVTLVNDTFQVEDIGQRSGLFVNGLRAEPARRLRDGDVVTFGRSDVPRLVFHLGVPGDSLPELLSRLDLTTTPQTGDRDLRQLSILLEATALLQSRMPLKEVLAAMVDRAITITRADRGLLFEADADNALWPLVARQRGPADLPLDAVSPSQTAIAQALQQRRSVVAQDLALAEGSLREAKSVVAQQLRSVVAVPLHSLGGLRVTDTTTPSSTGGLLGMLYLDSRSIAAFSTLERQILDALASEAASIIENARLIERDRERRRLEQELSIAREIQQKLLPKDFHTFPYLEVTGINLPSYEVSGDYFDLMEVGEDRAAFVIADVAGKGLSAAMVTAILQGSMAALTLGQDPAHMFTTLNRFISTRSEMWQYATLFFGILSPDGRLEFINAAHHSPLLIRGGKIDQPFPAECMPLGLFETTTFKSHSVTLEPNDTLVFFTDGISEAMNNLEEEYGVERLRSVVAGYARAPVEELQAAILAAIDDFARGMDQADDITLLILRYRGPA